MWNESLILTRLSQARKLLENSQQTEESGAFNLCQLRIRVRRCNRDDEGGGDGLEIAHVRTSDKEDENSFGVKFLVGLLKCPNQVLAYAAIKALVALSDFIQNTRRDLWPSFILALWKDARCWVSCPDPTGLKKVQVYSKVFLQNGESEPKTQAHEDACLLAASNTLQTLHQCLKRCLKSFDENIENKLLSRNNMENLEVFLCLLTTRVSKVATAICNAEEQKDVDKHISEPCREHIIQGLPRELILGALLRLLCTGSSIPTSISDPKNHRDVTRGAYLDMSLALIPVMSSSALPLHKNCTARRCISTYLRHKLLMLMLKLSKWFHIRPSLASSCYTALRSHGSDLLEFGLQDYNNEKNLSDESPFFKSLLVSSRTEASVVPSIRRLRRRALLLLFRIAHAAHRKADADRVSMSVQPGVIIPAKRSREELTPQCKCELPPRVYLRDWMKIQYQLGVRGLSEEMANLTGICEWVNQLASSLIQLYLEEDDLLLMMMMQLSDMQYLSTIFLCPEHPPEDMLCRIAVEAFLPARLIHAFLAAINFDYSTVEKLLTSKTTGALCLTYFMRSLRHISDSWPDFVHASPWTNSDVHCTKRGHELNECKMRSHKLQCRLCSYEDMCSQGVFSYDDETVQKYMNLNGNAQEKLDRCCCDCSSEVTAPVDGVKRIHHPHLFLTKAAECLHGLEVRIGDMHKNAVFPYNPTPLLSRLKVVVDLLKPYSTELKETEKQSSSNM